MAQEKMKLIRRYGNLKLMVKLNQTWQIQKELNGGSSLT